MFFTFPRSACTTQNFRTKKGCRIRNQMEKNIGKRWQSLPLHMTSEPKRSKENKVVKMDHSPGWGSICCLGEEKWSARKQLRWGTWVASSWKHLHASSWPAANLPLRTCSAWIQTPENKRGNSASSISLLTSYGTFICPRGTPKVQNTDSSFNGSLPPLEITNSLEAGS